jgi:heptosyltransferase-2
VKILIEPPTWLGDAVMATAAIEALLRRYPDAEVTLVGSYVATEALKRHSQVVRSDVLDKGWLALRRKAKALGSFDLALSFRSSARSAWFLFGLDAAKTCQFPKSYSGMHQVEKYYLFLEECGLIEGEAGDLKLYEKPYHYERPTLGINPGASYGSAKRWYPEAFARVAIELSGLYDIVIFGGPGEESIAGDIERAIRAAGVENVQNLAGQTTIPELLSRIGGLAWLVTNDSGPMHVAAAYQIPTVALFGPTKHEETSQWHNPRDYILRKEMECAPCMKRTCPLKHHDCMKQITADEVIALIRSDEGRER